jgi:hypothetical protein
VADHTPKHDEEKHWTRFLNQDTAFFVGADKIAKILKAPVIYVAMRRDGRAATASSSRSGRAAVRPRLGSGDRRALRAHAGAGDPPRAPPIGCGCIRKWKYDKPLYA